MSGRRLLIAAGLLATLVTMASACRFLDPFSVRQQTRDQYLRSLEEAGLADRRMTLEWVAAARAAVGSPTRVSVPYRETGFFDPARPEAAAFLLELRPGERVDARIETEPPELPLFLELVRPGREGWESVATAPDGRQLHYRPRRGERLVLLLQPELLAGGRYTLDLVVQGALLFPVDEAGSAAIASRFGDPRDGGRRLHEGIDILAPRGTRALAADDGTVERVDENRLGGKVVWMSTDGGLTLYYAHLDRQLVRSGQRVRRGQPVGRVGNTGNARGTSPHLHFGVSAGGAPLDPEPWIRPATPPEPVTADLRPLGRWSRISRDGSRLRAGPSTGTEILGELPLDHPVRVLAASRDWYRLELPQGGSGYAAAFLLAPAEAPLRTVPVLEPLALRAAPAATAPPVGWVEPGQSIGILARTGETILVTAPSGLRGWTELP